MRRFALALVFVASFAWLALPARASSPRYRCVSGERIEEGSSTVGHYRTSGSGVGIEKGSSTVGWVKRRGDRWAIETFGGSTLGWLVDGRIETPGGSTRTTVDTARRLADCSDEVAAGIWVLQQDGRF
ncbi:MAG: hypothetical protein KC731_13405 [Myxococcales bacterium]|nr:hypothetical protein [Myxococcales bacterium]